MAGRDEAVDSIQYRLATLTLLKATTYPLNSFEVPFEKRVQGEDHIMAQALELKREREIYSDLVSRARVKQLLLQLSAGVHQHLLTTQYYLQSKGELNLGYLGTTESIFDS